MSTVIPVIAVYEFVAGCGVMVVTPPDVVTVVPAISAVCLVCADPVGTSL